MKYPFYWIDNSKEYDKNMFQKGMKAFEKHACHIAKEYNLEFTPLDFEKIIFGYDESPQLFYEGEDLMAKKACVYVPYSNPQAQTEQLLHALARLVISSNNWVLINGDATSLHLDKDKEIALELARRVGVKTVPAWFIPERTYSRSQIDTIEKLLGPYPYIIKPSSMLAGLGIIKADNREVLRSLLDYIALSPRSYLIQPFLKNACDCRVYVENFQIIACQKRTPPKGHFLSNVSQSGHGEAVDPDPKIADFSIQLAKQIGSGYVCIDWLIGDEGIFFSEIDFTGMFFGLPEPEKTKVAHAFFRSAKRKLETLC